ERGERAARSGRPARFRFVRGLARDAGPACRAARIARSGRRARGPVALADRPAAQYLVRRYPDPPARGVRTAFRSRPVRRRAGGRTRAAAAARAPGRRGRATLAAPRPAARALPAALAPARRARTARAAVGRRRRAGVQLLRRRASRRL